MLQSKQILLELNAQLAETLTSKGITAMADETTTTLVNKVANISGANKLIEYNQVRPEVQSYLNNVTYDPTDYTTSQIADYVTGTSNNQPVGCKINLKSAGILIIYDSANGGSTITNSVAGNNYIYNLTPNAICHYVNIVDGDIEQSGTVKATGACRMIKSASAYNIRDIGGWSCDGGTVKYGKLFRGGEVSPEDAPVLVDYLGIKHDINLRGKSEATWTTSPLGENVKFHIYDSYAWYSISNSNLLTSILKDIFEAVSNNEPAYFHCSVGADRTGTIAFILEALLGMNQSDIDKDYELSCFYTGVSSDNASRRRNENDWIGLVNSFSNYTGDTLRDKVVSWVLSLGISIDDINNFRSKMIDGAPEILQFSGNTYSISTNINNASLGNSETSAKQFSSYSTEIIPDEGYIISDISVVMDGKDITSSVFQGTHTNFNFSVKNTLLNCSTNNKKIAVIANQSYGAVITANNGYSLENADINIKMGGIEMPEYYSNGNVVIPVVTGDIEISITAKISAPEYTNQILTSTDAEGNIVGLLKNKRYNSSDTLVDSDIHDACGFIPVKENDVVRFKNMGFGSIADGSCYLRLYSSDKQTKRAETNPYSLNHGGFPTEAATKILNIKYDNNDVIEFTVGSSCNYLRIAWRNVGQTEPAIITVNEEIV